MPTGYTADVQSGKVRDFPEFAMQCARAFGACIMMRDDPSDAVIPDEFKPSEYHTKALSKARDEATWLDSATNDELIAAIDIEFSEEHERWRVRKEERTLHRARYSDMRDKVEAWIPPSDDHKEMKKFMLNQLNESMRFDCSRSYDEEPVKKTVDEWKEAKRVSIAWDIDYHEKQNREEEERAASRTKWIRQLRESLQGQPVTA